jgi:hypothetical protein
VTKGKTSPKVTAREQPGLRVGWRRLPVRLHGPADYSSTAYWYGTSAASLSETDTLDAADDANRAAHNYRADGESRDTLTSTFRRQW